MKERIGSFCVLWLAVLGILALGGVSGGVLLLILASLLTQYELCQLCRKAGYEPYLWHCLGYGLLMLLLAYFPPAPMCGVEAAMMVFVCALIETTFHAFSKKEPRAIIGSLVSTVCNLVYLPLMFSLPIAMLRDWSSKGEDRMALACLLWIIAVAKFSDVSGLCVGSLCGGQKLAPQLSPAKTRRGLIGAVILAPLLVGLGSRLLFTSFFPKDFSPLRALLLAILIALIAAFSDLVESTVKRLAQVKDSGKLIPGIGGIFDLTDSLILALPVGVLYFHYWEKISPVLRAWGLF
ncbi:MAG: phosphatidate cytidylyltransferase [Puniceicoccales bacterium]|jgi:phosphatidate cytidylyltransferase|nr:phosphatidate cytidylyltransferase [Puniceicoccales bacterium]